MILREMEIMKLKKRLFALLLTALMLVTMVPAVSFAAGENTFTLYQEPGGSVYKTAKDYDPAKPEMLDMGVTKAGYTFTGWYVEDASGAFAAETTTETKYYNTTSTEKSTTSPDFTSGKSYYTKVEIYTPMMNGTNFRRFRVNSGDTAPDGAYILYKPITGSQKTSKYADNEIAYLDVYNYYSGQKGSVDELDALIPSGYTGNFSDVYVPVVLTPELKSAIIAGVGDGSFESPVRTAGFTSSMKTTSTSSTIYTLYEKVSNKTPVTASSYVTGTTVYYMDTTKTEIPASDYDASNPAHSAEPVTTPTGAFNPKTGSEPAGTKYYSLASMTPAAAMGAVSYYAGWTDATVPTYTLNDGNGTVSSRIAYDPTSPVALPTPARAGYTFAGWIDSSSAAVTKTPATDQGHVTFTATWTFANYLTSGKIAKAYDRTFATAAEGIATEDILAETITYTITAYDSTNREVGKDALDMPAITPVDITVGDGDDTATIAFPDFNGYGIGDYWYKVVETAGTTAGVTYDTTVYYLHLVVTDEDETGVNVGVSSYGIHTATDVDVTDPDNKVQGFTNVYNSGELSIEKQVTGNMGDPDKYFKVTVTFTAPTGTTVTGPISYTGGFADDVGSNPYTSTNPGVIEAADWTGDSSVSSVVVYLKDDTTVTFTNIPEGVTYAIVEADYSADGYEASYAFAAADTGDSASATSATGTIEDASDAVTITNNKDVAVDVGVILEDMPYLLIVGVCVAALVLVVLKRRKHSAD